MEKKKMCVDSCPLQDDSLTGLLGQCCISSLQNKTEGLASNLMGFLCISPTADDAMSFVVHHLSLYHSDAYFHVLGPKRGTSLCSLVQGLVKEGKPVSCLFAFILSSLLTPILLSRQWKNGSWRCNNMASNTTIRKQPPHPHIWLLTTLSFLTAVHSSQHITCFCPHL